MPVLRLGTRSPLFAIVLSRLKQPRSCTCDRATLFAASQSVLADYLHVWLSKPSLAHFEALPERRHRVRVSRREFLAGIEAEQSFSIFGEVGEALLEQLIGRSLNLLEEKGV